MIQVTPRLAEQFHGNFTSDLESALDKSRRLKRIKRDKSQRQTNEYVYDLKSAHTRYSKYLSKRKDLEVSLRFLKSSICKDMLERNQVRARKLLIARVALLTLGVALLLFALLSLGVTIAVMAPAVSSAFIVSILGSCGGGVFLGSLGLFFASFTAGIFSIVGATMRHPSGFYPHEKPMSLMTHHDWNLVKDNEATIASQEKECSELEPYIKYYENLLMVNEGSVENARFQVNGDN